MPAEHVDHLLRIASYVTHCIANPLQVVPFVVLRLCADSSCAPSQFSLIHPNPKTQTDKDDGKWTSRCFATRRTAARFCAARRTMLQGINLPNDGRCSPCSIPINSPLANSSRPSPRYGASRIYFYHQFSARYGSLLALGSY